MIINVDSNLEAYKHLLQTSYQLLSSKDLLPDDYKGQDRFSSLEEMFANMAIIVGAQPNYLIKLPIEEPALKIDANKRTIDTTMFNYCVNVQSDNMAEILVFSVDRYFDYVDLGHPNMKILVQWTAPDGKGGTVNGATPVELRDVETEPGKLRFGWPLNDVITANPGKLQFAVRFFLQDDVNDFDGAGNPIVVKNKIVYSLNTRPAELTIQKALQPDLNDETEIHNPHGLFSSIVANSIYSGKDIVVPQTPSFEAPGLQLPIEATLNDEDTLTLIAQAVTGDTSSIDYEWYYKAVGATSFTKCEEGVGVAYRRSTSTKKVISDDYYSSQSATAEEGKDIYYYALSEDNFSVHGFALYTGTVSTKELANGDIVMVDDNDNPLYEKYTTYTVPPAPTEVTGEYQVRAVASKTYGSKVTTGGERYSRKCKLISPSDITIVNDLADYSVIEGDPAKAALTIDIVRAEGDNTSFVYHWRKYESKEALSYDEVKTNTGAYDATVPGWYKVYITASLNRQTNDSTSEWCKVTNLPTTPDLAAGTGTKDGEYDEDDNTLYIIPSTAGENVTLVTEVTNLTAGGVDDLQCETLSYSWTIGGVDGGGSRPLEVGDLATGTDINTNTIVVSGPATGKINIYTCTVTNTLNHKIASSTFAFQVQ